MAAPRAAPPASRRRAPPGRRTPNGQPPAAAPASLSIATLVERLDRMRLVHASTHGVGHRGSRRWPVPDPRSAFSRGTAARCGRCRRAAASACGLVEAAQVVEVAAVAIGGRCRRCAGARARSAAPRCRRPSAAIAAASWRRRSAQRAGELASAVVALMISSRSFDGLGTSAPARRRAALLSARRSFVVAAGGRVGRVALPPRAPPPRSAAWPHGLPCGAGAGAAGWRLPTSPRPEYASVWAGRRCACPSCAPAGGRRGWRGRGAA